MIAGTATAIGAIKIKIYLKVVGSSFWLHVVRGVGNREIAIRYTSKQGKKEWKVLVHCGQSSFKQLF